MHTESTKEQRRCRVSVYPGSLGRHGLAQSCQTAASWPRRVPPKPAFLTCHQERPPLVPQADGIQQVHAFVSVHCLVPTMPYPSGQGIPPDSGFRLGTASSRIPCPPGSGIVGTRQCTDTKARTCWILRDLRDD